MNRGVLLLSALLIVLGIGLYQLGEQGDDTLYENLIGVCERNNVGRRAQNDLARVVRAAVREAARATHSQPERDRFEGLLHKVHEVPVPVCEDVIQHP